MDKNKPHKQSAAPASSSLARYNAKRDFKLTKEPAGKVAPSKNSRFVIQKHDASRLHYDFRLELDGVLKSWAVPKGIPLKKGEKHLAVEVEDHPLDYAHFEGIIPQGQYGGGTVMVWDTGTYECLGSTTKKDLAEGKLHFALHGKKLNGEWTLIRIKHSGDNDWLLLKSGDDAKPISSRKDDTSAISARSMSRIAKERDAEWTSHHEQKTPKLKFIEPMKATLVTTPPTGAGWQYELKFDGYRAIALKSGKNVELLSRNEKDFTKRFPEIAQAVAALSINSATFDGEIVAMDAEGRSSFQLLQALEIGNERPPLAYYIFDLLNHDGVSLLDRPLSDRRKLLHKLLAKVPDPIRESAEIQGDPKKLLAEIKRRGLEGIIGKQSNSTYQPGQRPKTWIKLKALAEQELVIGGYTPPDGTRKFFGALIVGYWQRKKLQFAGKVGTGFTAPMLKSLHAKMRPLSRDTCPFANLPEKKQGRWSQNITPREMKLCHWIEPKLVAQVRFTEWTTDGKLRHPAFLGLREDKPASEVTREHPIK